MTAPAKTSKAKPAKLSLGSRLEALAQLSESSAGHARPKDRMRAILKATRQILPFSAATLYAFDRESERLVEVVSVGGGAELVEFLPLGVGAGLSGWTAMERQPLLLSSRTTPNQFSPDADYETFLSLPLVVRDSLQGALNLGFDEADAVTDDDMKLAALVSIQLAHEIASLYHEKSKANLENKLKKIKYKLNHARNGLTALEKIARAANTAESVVHQINNPLSVVVGNVQCLVAERGAVNQKALARLRRVEAAAIEISEVTRKLLQIHAMANTTDTDNEQSIT